MSQQAVQFIKSKHTSDNSFPSFRAGDAVTVRYRIVEETKERIQSFKGIVLKKQGQAHTTTFTVRKISNGIGVERIFPLYSPFIDSIEVSKKAKTRRAKLLYLRGKGERAMRLKERISSRQTKKTKVKK